MSRFIAPKDSLRWLCKDYLKRALIQLSEKKIPYFVIHVGATKDLEIKEVQQQLDKMMTYSRLGESSLSEFLEDPKITTKILVENVACVAPFNSTLKPLMESLSKYPKLGWVLDTHHAYAAGIPEEEISQAVANNQPDVIHLNFYNAPKGSGKDRHGWRSGQNGLKLSEKKHNITDSDIDFWDNFAKEQFIKGTPLILEGSKEKDSSMELEIEFLKTKILS
jgi:endonuclease IV